MTLAHPRPAVACLGSRRAPPLHRTLPTWARERTERGIEYRIYVPAGSGAAVFTRDLVAPSASRAEVAKLLRARRRMLWGRDRLPDRDELVPPAKPTAASGALPMPLAEPPTSPPPPLTTSRGLPEQASLF